MSDQPNFDISESNPNKVSRAERTESINEAGGVSFDPDTAEFELFKVVINNLLEDSYYDTAEESYEKLQDAFDSVAETNPEFILQLAVYARQEEGLRDIAQLLLVMAANDDRVTKPENNDVSWVRDYAPSIIDRTDEFNSVISYQKRIYGKPIPSGLQKGIEDAWHKSYAMVRVEYSGTSETERVTYIDRNGFVDDVPSPGIARAVERVAERNDVDPGQITDWDVVDAGYIHNQYTASKYLQQNKAVSLYDVINLCRPNPRSDNRDDLFGRIVHGELDDHEDVEPLREDSTWEAERSSDTTEIDVTITPDGVEHDSAPMIVINERDTLRSSTQYTFVFAEDESSVVSIESDSIEGGVIVEDDNTFTVTDELMVDMDELDITVEADLTEADEFRHRLDDMGLMARTRNLRNMLQAGIEGREIFDYDQSVGGDGDGTVFGPESKRVVKNSKMLPFRLYQSYKACSDVGISRRGRSSFDIGRDALLDDFSNEWLNSAIDTATDNLPDTLDNTFTAIDLSGSMDSPISGDSETACAEIGTVFGAMLMKCGSNAGAFGDDFATVEMDDDARASTGTLEIASRLYDLSSSVGNSTNAWKSIRWATENEKEYDRFIVLTDMQIWDSTTGVFGGSTSTVKKEWDRYTQEVNSDAKLFTVDLASYGDCAMPENYKNVHQISGWSESVIEFIDSVEQADDVINGIEAVEPEDY